MNNLKTRQKGVWRSFLNSREKVNTRSGINRPGIATGSRFSLLKIYEAGAGRQTRGRFSGSFRSELYLCLMRKLRMDELPRKSTEEFRLAEKLPVILVLDNIRSMHNVGSFFRTADAFLAESIYLCGYTPRPPHRDIHKTALGATDTVEWKYMESAARAVQQLRDAGYHTVAIEQVEGSIPLQSFKRTKGEKLAVVFGNEVEGVSEEALAYCRHSIEIPQFGMKHSLNVSVAAGIVLWEMVRAMQGFENVKS